MGNTFANKVIVAIKDMSAGNESIGEMWKETRIFHPTDKLEDVMHWAESFKKNVVLTVADAPKEANSDS